MEYKSFKNVPIGNYFIWHDWVFKKLSHDTAKAEGYAASNYVDADTVVTDLENWREVLHDV